MEVPETEDPFGHPDRWYRVQTHEEQRYENDEWITYWMAEVWRLAQGNLAARQLGDSGWKSEVTIKNSYGVDIPELSESKIMIGAGPGTDGTVKVSPSPPTTGRTRTEFDAGGGATCPRASSFGASLVSLRRFLLDEYR